MKRKVKKFWKKKDLDRETLKYWKSLSTKTKMNWLEESLNFSKFKKYDD